MQQMWFWHIIQIGWLKRQWDTFASARFLRLLFQQTKARTTKPENKSQTENESQLPTESSSQSYETRTCSKQTCRFTWGKVSSFLFCGACVLWPCYTEVSGTYLGPWHRPYCVLLCGSRQRLSPMMVFISLSCFLFSRAYTDNLL